MLVVLVAYAALVATHEGEFWPFSIFPMFSQAGNPWSRALVRDVSDVPAVAWDTLTVADLPGESYALVPHGVDQIDLANYVSKTRFWDANRVEGIRRMFAADDLDGRRLLVYRVNGTPEADSIAVRFVPYVLLTQDTTRLHPDLPRQATEVAASLRSYASR